MISNLIRSNRLTKLVPMGKNSNIEWTDHTFNPWWGCTKVSPACDNCYAEKWSHRLGKDLWGHKSERRFLSDANWKNPLKWNRLAEATGVRPRVFCASMADVFEWRSDLRQSRNRLWGLIEETPALDWLLLTKRPQNITRLAPWRAAEWPKNVWLGTTAENQKWADKRVPKLLEVQPETAFLSCEPLLGAINLTKYLDAENKLDWVIAGGETGGEARPTNIEWFRSLRDQCVTNDVAFHFKQWGDWGPSDKSEASKMVRAGKKKTGRELDGRTWDELPDGVRRAMCEG